MSIPIDRFAQSLVETAEWYQASYPTPPSEDPTSHSVYIASLVSSNYPHAPQRSPLPSQSQHTSTNLSTVMTTTQAPAPMMLASSASTTTPNSSSFISETHHAASTNLINQRFSSTMLDTIDSVDNNEIKKAPAYKLTRVIKGHEGWVTSVDIDIGNKLFSTCSNDNTIKIWDFTTGLLLFTFTGHLLPVNSVKFSHLHPRLFSASNDREAKMWDLETNTFIHNLHGHKKAVNCVEVHPNLDIAITGSTDNTVKLWDIRTKKAVRTLEGHQGGITSIIGLPTDPQVISASLDTSIRLWDIGTGKTISTHSYHKKSIRKIITHPVDYTLISASSDDVKKWRLPILSSVPHEEKHNWDNVQKGLIAALPPAQQLAKVGNLKPCQEDICSTNLTFMTNFRGSLQTTTGHSVIHSLALNRENVLLSARADGVIDCYDYRTGLCYDSIQTPPIQGSLASEASICDIAFDMTGNSFLTACADKTVKMYSAQR